MTRLRPRWDGIIAWAAVVLGAIVLVAATTLDTIVNGAEGLGMALVAAGAAYVATVVAR